MFKFGVIINNQKNNENSNVGTIGIFEAFDNRTKVSIGTTVVEKQICRSAYNATERDYAYNMLDEYLNKLERRGRKLTTLCTYRHILDVQIRFLSDRGLHCSPERISEKEVYAIMKGYPDISDWTKKYYIEVLSRWIMSVSDNTVVKDMDLLWAQSERPNRIWAVYRDAEALFEIEEDLRNKLIIALAMDEGMRAGEISAVRNGDIRDGWISIRGKGHGDGKMRSMPISERVSRTIEQWYPIRNAIVSQQGDNGRLIVTKNGRPLTAHNVTVRVIRMSDKAGYNITAHSLRRRFITDTLNSGVRIEVCAKMVGHENPMITAMYYQCDAESIEDAMEQRAVYFKEIAAEIKE